MDCLLFLLGRFEERNRTNETDYFKYWFGTWLALETQNLAKSLASLLDLELLLEGFGCGVGQFY